MTIKGFEAGIKIIEDKGKETDNRVTYLLFH